MIDNILLVCCYIWGFSVIVIGIFGLWILWRTDLWHDFKNTKND